MYMVDCKKNGDQLIGNDSSEGTMELELTGDLDQHQFEAGDSQDGQTLDEQESLQSYQLTRDKIRRQIKTPARFFHVDMASFALNT